MLAAAVLVMLPSSPSGSALAPTPVDTPASPGARLPRLGPLPGGGALLSWVEPEGDGHALRFAVLRAGRSVRQGKVASGPGWFVNWADFPSVVAIDDDFWVAHWLVLHPGGGAYNYDIALAVSRDGGRHWRAIGPPHRDGVAAEHGFAVLFRDGDAAGILWLDGRDFSAPGPGSGHGPGHAGHAGSFALRFARILRDGRPGAEEVLDADTCTCCWPAVTALPEGAFAAWRGHTGEEIRDHRTARRRGSAWSPPAELGGEGWRIAGCPVNGPALAARGHRLLAAWFTAADERPRVRAALSEDAGGAFGPAFDLDTEAPLGRIAALWLDDDQALVGWLAASADGEQAPLVFRRVAAGGAVAAPRPLASVAASRDSGVPQMLGDGEDVYLAWTRPGPAFGLEVRRVSRQDLLN
jgi:hypothetical protein